MFEFKSDKMRLKYYYEGADAIIDCGTARFGDEGYDDWLDSMVKTDDNIIFFLTTETTDVFEKVDDESGPLVITDGKLHSISLDSQPNAFGETINFNTVVSMGDDGVLTHTYDPDCPQGCRGQLEGCVHKPKTVYKGRPMDRADVIPVTEGVDMVAKEPKLEGTPQGGMILQNESKPEIDYATFLVQDAKANLKKAERVERLIAGGVDEQDAIINVYGMETAVARGYLRGM